MNRKKESGSYKNIITIVVLIAVGALLAYGMFGTSFSAENDILKITGLHGQKIPFSDINSISLENSLPTITAKTGGFSLAGKRLGNFTTSEYGKVKLFLFNSTAPYIYVEADDGSMIILNTSNADKTKELYQKLSE